MDISNLKYFVLFIGHGRSGHSLFGALLNAHPNAVIANELDILRMFDMKSVKERQIYKAVLKKGPQVWKHIKKRKKDWPWLSGYEDLQVLGTKKGGGTESYLRDNYGDLHRLKKTLSVPIKFIHVKRNMYDNISTVLKKGGPKFGFSDLDTAIDRYFAGIPVIKKVRSSEDFLEIKHEDFIADPKRLITEACEFLDLSIRKDYLDFCTSVVWKEPRVTRHTVNWEDRYIDRVERLKHDVEFLKEYTFDN